MYGYFIHTMELSQSIYTEEFNKLKMSIRLFPENKGADNNRWRSLDYEESGITIVIRKSSLNEKLFLNRGKDYAQTACQKYLYKQDPHPWRNILCYSKS